MGRCERTLSEMFTAPHLTHGSQHLHISASNHRFWHRLISDSVSRFDEQIHSLVDQIREIAKIK